MSQSMTGYSRVTHQGAFGAVTVELRSTNHRYLEVSQRMPDGLVGFEGLITQRIRRTLKRGRIDVNVTMQAPRAASSRVVLNEALAQAYYTQLLELKARFGLKGAVTLDHLLAFPLVLNAREDQTSPQSWWPAIERTLDEALRKLLAMRRLEGQRLLADLCVHVKAIRRCLRAIRARLPVSMAQQQRRLRGRIRELLGTAATVTASQIQEAVALMKEVDIHEELVRLESHLTHTQHVLASREPMGKNLDFIAQELMRETNTIGAKANDVAIARSVIEMKGAIEKIREQAQNLE